MKAEQEEKEQKWKNEIENQATNSFVCPKIYTLQWYQSLIRTKDESVIFRQNEKEGEERKSERKIRRIKLVFCGEQIDFDIESVFLALVCHVPTNFAQHHVNSNKRSRINNKEGKPPHKKKKSIELNYRLDFPPGKDIFDELNRIFNIEDDDDDSDQNIISNRMRALNSILELLNEESSLFFQIFM
uniref:Uncharacterized protein n=1 Tax=Romanomermis culicivorax TaxID=13658 RepID=A0A915JSR4_ROMCU